MRKKDIEINNQMKKFEDIVKQHIKKADVSTLQATIQEVLNDTSNEIKKSIDTVNQNLPLNGSGFAVKEFLNAINEANKTDPKYLILLFEYLNYFTGFWKIEGDDDLNNVWPEFMYSLMIFGTACLKREKKANDVDSNGFNEIGVYGSYDTTCDAGGNIISGVGTNFQPFLLISQPKTAALSEKKLVREKNKCAFFKWGVSGLTILFTLNPFILEQIKILNSMFDNHDLTLKRFKYTINNSNPEIVKAELESMIKSNARVLIQFGKKLSTNNISSISLKNGNKALAQMNTSQAFAQNEIEPSEISYDNVNEEAHNNYNYLYNLISKMIGRYANISYKTARNLQGEVDINNAIFDIIIDSFEKQLLKGLEIISPNAKLIRVLEEKKKRELETEVEAQSKLQQNNNQGDKNGQN